MKQTQFFIDHPGETNVSPGKKNLTCVDAFSGAGGLSVGLKRAGFNILLSFDNDQCCIDTQKRNQQHLGAHTVRAGIEEMLGGRLLEKVGMHRGELDLLAGGPPCQGFSIQRIGANEDSRNDLVSLYVELIKEVAPSFFLMENVVGIGGQRGRVVLDSAINAMSLAGYRVHKKVLDAQDFGVPQRRRRFFLIGEREDIAARGTGFLFPTPTTPEGKRLTVRETISHLPPPPEDGQDHPSWIHHRRDKLSKLNISRLESLSEGQGRDDLPRELLATCHLRSSELIGHRNVYGRMLWDAVAPTITARFDSFTRGQFGHPAQIRTISLREGALLQTFPHDFVFSGNKVDIARQIGNAVPPRLAEAVSKQIVDVLLGIENTKSAERPHQFY
jgi:DNA (cytosine-5)-methyltransferase 1